MGRVAAAPIRALAQLGDLEYGGAGSVTGTERVTTRALGVRSRRRKHDGTFLEAFTAWSPAAGGDVMLDGELATSDWLLDYSGAGPLGTAYEYDLVTPQRIGSYRYVQTQAGRQWAGTKLYSSHDAIVWTERDAHSPGVAYADTGVKQLAAPVLARYWAQVGTGLPTFGPVMVAEFQLFAVTTVGAGNPSRLASPGARRLLSFDPDNGAPQWLAPAAANPDTAGAILADVETELNQVKAALRAAGLLAS